MRLAFLSLLLASCTPPDARRPPPGDDGVGLIGDGLANPFPNTQLVGDSGLLLGADDFPQSGSTPIPVERVAWRTGFSPAQTSVLRIPGLKGGALPHWTQPTPGEGGVRLLDRTTGLFLPVFAELDAHPEADPPALLIRPLEALSVGHEIAVVLTTDVLDRPERFGRLLDGRAPSGLKAVEGHYLSLVEDIVASGISESDIALAWDFPIGDGRRPLVSALDQIALDGEYGFTRIRDVDLGDAVAPMTYRSAEGSFVAQDFLVEDRLLSLTADGSATSTGMADVDLYIHIPSSVADAPAGTVPILVFGHGIFSHPADYLDDSDDPSGVLQLAEEAGFVVIATVWRGLTTADRVEVVEAAADFGTLPVVTDRLVQGQTNMATLIALIQDDVFSRDPVFSGRQDQPLLDPSQLFYYGISLGGIEGAVALAQDPPFSGTVLHVGGGMWSTMLERSSNWTVFEFIMVDTVEEPSDRQLLYAASQLWWDPVDPMSWTVELASKNVLFQESIGDEQVANLTTEALARSMGLGVLEPSVRTPFAVDLVGPMPPGSRALVQFDPETALPEDGNRPAAVTRAHSEPRLWTGTRRQVIDYLLPGSEEQVVHHCGDTPCAASNPGD
jgi:hypothetical protein